MELFRESFLEAIEMEQFGLKVCWKHRPEPVIYDEYDCPLCSVLKEMRYAMERTGAVKSLEKA